MKEEISRRSMLTIGAVGVGMLVGSSLSDDGNQRVVPTGGGGGGVTDVSDSGRVLVGDDFDAAYQQLSKLPGVLLHPNQGLVLLESDSPPNIATIRMSESINQIVIAESLEEAKTETDRYPALLISRAGASSLLTEN